MARSRWAGRAAGFGRMLKESFVEWNNDNASRLGAAVAFYTLFSLGPLLLLVTAIAGRVFGPAEVRAELLDRLSSVMGAEQVKTVADILDNAATHTSAKSAAAILGVVTLVSTGTILLVQLKGAMNVIWNVKPNPKATWVDTIKPYLIAAVGIVVLGLVLMASLILSTTVGVLDKYFIAYLPAPAFLLQAANFAISFLIEMGLFAMMFKWLPDTPVRWREVAVGALFTALLFEIGKIGISAYMARQSYQSTYGAAGSFVAIGLWVYYSSQIVFFGAEFTQIHARHMREAEPPGPDRPPALPVKAPACSASHA